MCGMLRGKPTRIARITVPKYAAACMARTARTCCASSASSQGHVAVPVKTASNNQPAVMQAVMQAGMPYVPAPLCAGRQPRRCAVPLRQQHRRAAGLAGGQTVGLPGWRAVPQVAGAAAPGFSGRRCLCRLSVPHQHQAGTAPTRHPDAGMHGSRGRKLRAWRQAVGDVCTAAQPAAGMGTPAARTPSRPTSPFVSLQPSVGNSASASASAALSLATSRARSNTRV